MRKIERTLVYPLKDANNNQLLSDLESLHNKLSISNQAAILSINIVINYTGGNGTKTEKYEVLSTTVTMTAVADNFIV